MIPINAEKSRQNSGEKWQNAVCIDWLRFSFPVESFQPVMALCGVSISLEEWQQKSSYRKKFVTYFLEGCLLASDSLPRVDLVDDGKVRRDLPTLPADGSARFILDFSGNGLGHFFAANSFLSPEKLVHQFYEWGGTCNRLDIAFDDYRGHLDIYHMDKRLRRGDAVVTRWRQAALLDSFAIGDGDRGETLYIGDRKSESFARVYNKRAQELARGADPVGLPASWVRFELELKRARADSVLKAALADGWTPTFFLGFLRSLIDFKRKDGEDENISRREPARWWARFLGEVGKRPVRIPQPVQSIERIKEWVGYAVSPSLALLLQHYEGDVTWLYDLIKEGADRLPPDKLILLKSSTHGS